MTDVSYYTDIKNKVIDSENKRMKKIIEKIDKKSPGSFLAKKITITVTWKAILIGLAVICLVSVFVNIVVVYFFYITPSPTLF